METSIKGIYIAGDVAGNRRSQSSAMVEGRLAGLCAAKSLGYDTENFEKLRHEYFGPIEFFRSGPVGEKIIKGLSKVTA